MVGEQLGNLKTEGGIGNNAISILHLRAYYDGAYMDSIGG